MTGPSRARARGRRAAARVRPGAARRRGAGDPGPHPGLPRGDRRWSGSTTSAATYWAGRATLCSGPGRPRPLRPGVHRLVPRRATTPVTRAAAGPAHAWRRPALDDERDGAGDGEADDDTAATRWPASAEVLRHRDIADLPAAEKARLAALFETLRPAPAAPAAPTAVRRGTAGDVDAAAHPAADAAPDGGARRDRLAAPRRPGRAGWCCWSTSPAR